MNFSEIKFFLNEIQLRILKQPFLVELQRNLKKAFNSLAFKVTK